MRRDLTWRSRYRDFILGIVLDSKDLDPVALRKKVSESYPSGQRSGHPYKAWLLAVEDVLGPSERKTRIEEERRKSEVSTSGQSVFDFDLDL